MLWLWLFVGGYSVDVEGVKIRGGSGGAPGGGPSGGESERKASRNHFPWTFLFAGSLSWFYEDFHSGFVGFSGGLWVLFL